MSDATILLVDDDEVLSPILTRVLTQQGYTVERATGAAEAVRLAREHTPQLGLLDIHLQNEDGVELAKTLRAQVKGLPLILMSAYPLSPQDYPDQANGFARVLTKPINLRELRQAVEAALPGPTAGGAKAGGLPLPGQALEQDPLAEGSRATEPEPAVPAGPDAAPEPERAAPAPRRWLARAGAAAAVVALLALALFVGGRFLGQPEGPPAKPPGARRMQAELVTGRRDTISVPADVLHSLAVQTAPAIQATEHLPLVLRGSLAFDADRLVRVRSRFAGEVVEIGKTSEGTGAFATVPRPLRHGDRVKKNELLAVVWSKDLGEKKSEYVDALSQLRVDQETLKRFEDLYREGGIPEGQLRQQRRAVETGLVAVNRAEQTLRVWRLTDEEMQELRDEAEKIRQRGGKRDAEKERSWARVEVRAPFAGVLVEKNVTLGDLVDTSTVLFQVANLDVLSVFAHAYGEDLPALRALPKDERRWTVRITSDPSLPSMPGTIDTIGSVVDPTQHTALVSGRIDNPGGALRAGEFITATIELPPPAEVVQVPIGALVEDGDFHIVFVQPDPKKNEFTMRNVLVVQRRTDVAFVRWARREWLLLSVPVPEAPLNPLVGALYELPSIEPYVRVVSSGALLMKGALDDLQAGKSE
jgi:cobalt-zinc-cadmium efflux system membrane fusion protein